jgi:predicted transcriptional regulator
MQSNKITKYMANHLKDYIYAFYKEVVKNANLTLIDITVLFYMVASKKERKAHDIVRAFRGSFSSVATYKSLAKLASMHLLIRTNINRKSYYYSYKVEHWK